MASENCSSGPKIPLLASSSSSSGISSNSLCAKLIDVEEAKNQILFSLPMIVVNSCFYFINLVSVMFAGHLGKLELAASNLANSWAMVTGFSFMVGLSGALETLCGQGYGAKMYRMLGIHLQASCIISFFFSVVISVIWWYSDMILILLHQDPDIAREAGVFLRFLIPGLFAYSFLQNILRFLQSQSIIMPLAFCSVGSLVIHIGISYALVHWTGLAFKGASLAASISIWISLLTLGLYVLLSKRFNHIWRDGLSFEPFHHILTNLKLALPSAAMVCIRFHKKGNSEDKVERLVAVEVSNCALSKLKCLLANCQLRPSLSVCLFILPKIFIRILEYWAFELLVLLAGLMPNSGTTTSVVAMCVNTQNIAYMISYGLSAAASTRVANELGAGNLDKAKHAMFVTLKLSVLLAIAVDLALFLGHDVWASLFSDSAEIINKFASMTPLLLISFVFDFIQGILSGVTRGCGWQHLAMCINLATFYFIGMPIAGLLAFKFNLHSQGLWLGLICGLAFQSSGLLLLTLMTRWGEVQVSTNSNRENVLLA